MDGGESKNLYFQYAPFWEITQHGKGEDWVSWDWFLPASWFYASYYEVCSVPAVWKQDVYIRLP